MTTDHVSRLNVALGDRYAIERQVGEGGMATVYLANDLKHKRSVALKVLKPELAAVVGAERFLAEIETTANLQHPNILPLFDSGEADGFLFYVMPYVEGETLRDRIDREKQLPVEDAVSIASAVANALQVAHDRGVVHRDIKPANILLSGGQPLVSDFGIALAVGAGGSSRLTETGLSVGTPYYMSPEQATGDRDVGPATDVYALAAVLYEMLTGDPPYIGSTAQAVLGKILQGDPVSVTAARRAVPANVDAAIRKALEKLPADRFTGAQDFSRALVDTGFRHGLHAEASGGPAAARWRRLALGFAATAAVLAAVAAWSVLRPEPPRPTIRASLELDPPPNLSVTSPGEIAIADDGSFFVYTGQATSADGAPELWIRRLSALAPVNIAGTRSASSPALSPNGREVAFVSVTGLSLHAVPLGGGVPRVLADSALCCVDWGDDGFIYYTSARFQVRRVPAAGGSSEALTNAQEGRMYWMPRLTRDGEALILGSATEDFQNIELRAMSLESREVVTIWPGVGVGLETTSGHLAGADQEGNLLLAPFDASKLELAGPAVPVIQGMAIEAGVSFDVSAEGTLVYLAQAGGAARYQPVWVDRSGGWEVVDPDWTVVPLSSGNNAGFSISPDGSQVAIGVIQDPADGGDIYIKTLPAGPFSRLTTDPGEQSRPRWTPDGRSVTYIGTDGQLDYRLLQRRSDGIGDPQVVATHSRSILEGVVSSDGTRLLRVGNAVLDDDVDIAVLLSGEDSASTGLTSPFRERAVALSPDGRWLAYESDETGRTEVYLRSFPDLTQRKVQISSAGGSAPVWAHSGGELFYVNGARDLVTVAMDLEDELRIGAQTSLFTIPDDILLTSLDYYAHYDVDVDDQRFMMLRSLGGMTPGVVVLVVNWLDEALEALGN